MSLRTLLRRWTNVPRDGFTLMEIMLVMGIIILLFVIALTLISPKSFFIRSYDKKRASEAKELESAIYQYSWDLGVYPETDNILTGEENAKPVCTEGINVDNTDSRCINLDILVPTYLKALPADNASPCTKFTGYQVYRNNGQITVTPMYLGTAPGDLPPNCEVWLGHYAYRRPLTIPADMVGTDLTDFPLLALIDPSIMEEPSITTRTQSLGQDIRFTTATGGVLQYWKESWQSEQIPGYGTDTVGTVWVRVPRIAATTDTTIYMFFGSGTAMDASSANTWEPSFTGVWPSVETTDATTNGHDATSNATYTNDYYAIPGLYGDFPGTAWLYDFVASPTVDGASTVSFWIYPYDDGTTKQCILCESASQGIFYKDNSIDLYYDDTDHLNDTALGTDQWYYVTIVNANGLSTIYINGQFDGDYSSSPAFSFALNYIGSNTPEGESLNARLDELRISTEARSLDWIIFEYQNMTSTLTVPAWGNEQQPWL